MEAISHETSLCLLLANYYSRIDLLVYLYTHFISTLFLFAICLARWFASLLWLYAWLRQLLFYGPCYTRSTADIISQFRSAVTPRRIALRSIAYIYFMNTHRTKLTYCCCYCWTPKWVQIIFDWTKFNENITEMWSDCKLIWSGVRYISAIEYYTTSFDSMQDGNSIWIKLTD